MRSGETPTLRTPLSWIPLALVRIASHRAALCFAAHNTNAMGKTYVSSEAGYISEEQRTELGKRIAELKDGEHSITVKGKTFAGVLNSPNGDREFTVRTITEAEAKAERKAPAVKKAPAKKSAAKAKR